MRPHRKIGKVFFDHPDALTKLFTQPNKLNYMEGKYFDNRGLKAIEAFEADIENNLVEWGSCENNLYYRTERYWYDYHLSDRLINCTRYCNQSWQRWDTWMNIHSCCVGKEWLMQEPQKSKWVPLFREGNSPRY